MNHLFNIQSSLLGPIFTAHKKAFIFVFIFSFVMNILMLTPSFYMLQIYDRVLTSFNPWTLLTLTLITIFLYGLMALLERVRSLINASIASNIENDLSQKVYAVSHRIQDQKTNIIQLLNDVVAIRQFISGPSFNSMLDVPWTPIFIFILFLFNFWMSVAAIISCAILIILTLANEKATKRGQFDASKLLATTSLSAHDSASHSEVVGVMGMKKILQQKWMKNHHAYSEKVFHIASLSANFSSLIKFFRLILQSLGLGLGAWLVLDNQIHPGMMIAGSILFSKTLGPIENISMILRQWEQLRFSESRLRDVIKDEYFVQKKISLPKPFGNLKVDGVMVTPPGNKIPAVLNLSFQSEAGQIIGILGPSGSGKSSLMRALVGAWPCKEGEIRWDGSHINDWNEDELGQYIGYVPQDIQLLRGTIAENIARFKEVESEAVIEAARHAKAHDMILKLPNGYNTLLGDGGSGLSGGQRQKIAIARALFGNPSIVILDEPSSFLDDKGRVELIQTMKLLQSKERMIIFTTHHRDVVEVATRILVLVEGKFQAFGDRTQILAKITRPAQSK